MYISTSRLHETLSPSKQHTTSTTDNGLGLVIEATKVGHIPLQNIYLILRTLAAEIPNNPMSLTIVLALVK
jgi:hypothetical protein